MQREVDRIARRGFDCLAWVWTVRGEGVLATAMAERAVELEPLHEPAWRALMATQAQFGSRADAVRTYTRCRDLLRDELGVSPDAETDRLYSQLLGDLTPRSLSGRVNEALVAQWREQRFPKPCVGCSIHPGGATQVGDDYVPRS